MVSPYRIPGEILKEPPVVKPPTKFVRVTRYIGCACSFTILAGIVFDAFHVRFVATATCAIISCILCAVISLFAAAMEAEK